MVRPEPGSDVPSWSWEKAEWRVARTRSTRSWPGFVAVLSERMAADVSTRKLA
jgi:hypothetical protein